MMADSNPNIKGGLLINSFLQVDDDLTKTLEEWIVAYENAPSHVPDVQMTHYYIMSMAKESSHIFMDPNWIKKKIAMNPIKPEERIFLLKGMMQSYSIAPAFANIDTPLCIIQSLNDYIVKPHHAEDMARAPSRPKPEIFRTTLSEGIKRTQVEADSKVKSTRKLLYYRGGHDIIDVFF